MKLVEEVNDEASHKGLCDSELATNKQTREKRHPRLRISLHKLRKRLPADDMASINGQAQGIRNAEEAKNRETIADAKGAQSTMVKAMQVLKDSYAKAKASAVI